MPKKVKDNYIIPRFLRQFYIVLKKRHFLRYIELSLKGKLGRGFISVYLGYLEARLFMIIYRLNLVNNIFMVKTIINFGVFYINGKRKKHINTRMQLGDFLQINKFWKQAFRDDMRYRLKKHLISRNIRNYYVNYIHLYFFFFKVYTFSDIKYPIRIDLYRAIDFIGPLR